MTPVFDWPKIEPLIARHSYIAVDGSKVIRIKDVVRALHGHITSRLLYAYIDTIGKKIVALAHAGAPHTARVYFIGDGPGAAAYVRAMVAIHKSQSPIGTESDHAPDDSRT